MLRDDKPFQHCRSKHHPQGFGDNHIPAEGAVKPSLHLLSSKHGVSAKLALLYIPALKRRGFTEILMNGDFQRRISRRFVREYGFYLQRELDDYVRPHDGVSLFRHAMRITASPESTVVTVESVLQIRFESWIETAAALGFTIFRETNNQAIEQVIAYQFSEQSPANQKRGIHLYEGSDEETMMNICHSSDSHSWSNVQAWQDSTDAIALMLSQRGPKSEG